MLLERESGGLDESRHESEFDIVSLHECVSKIFPHVDVGRHVYLIESCEHGVCVLSILQSISDSKSHSVHWDSGFGPRAIHGGRGFLSGS